MCRGLPATSEEANLSKITQILTPAMSLSVVSFCIMLPILMQIDPLIGTAGTYFPSVDKNCYKNGKSSKKFVNLEGASLLVINHTISLFVNLKTTGHEKATAATADGGKMKRCLCSKVLNGNSNG